MSKLAYNNISLGSDPEFMIADKNGKFISSIGKIPGEKENPHYLPMLGDGFAIQKDNVLGEFNIPVSYSPHEATKNIAIMKSYIAGFLKQFDAHAVHVASAIYDEGELSHPDAKMFGCSVDYDAWREVANKRPKGEKTCLRSSGCHIHVGYDNPNFEQNILLIKAMDLFLGVPSVLIDDDNQRRALYGKAGCFRTTGFGVEYRVLSGFFISSDEVTLWAFNQTMEAIKFLNENVFAKEILEQESKYIIKCINSGDKRIAMKLVEKYNINYKTK